MMSTLVMYYYNEIQLFMELIVVTTHDHSSPSKTIFLAKPLQWFDVLFHHRLSNNKITA